MERAFLPVNCWAAEDIPSNKLFEGNPEHMSNAELLSIIIGTGSDKENSVDLARRILVSCGNKLSGLAKKCNNPNNLTHIRGVGKQKAAKIMAALELGKRRLNEEVTEKPDLGTATRIYNMMYPILCDLDVEEFWVLLMNQHYRLIKKFRLSVGGFTETSVDIRVIIREACLANATILSVVHNHPSGHLSPSKADESLTRDLNRACQLMRIHFSDHVIITDGAYYSFREQGII